ncbi:MAG: serine/threonine-protein kinase [Myxococcota bacterium]
MDSLCEVHRVGRYRLGDRLGSGGMGTVYRAHDPELGRDVAIKLLHQTDLTSQVRMRREARAMASLSHPNVLPVYDVAVHEGQLFIAMELVIGRNLRQWLAVGRRRWPAVLERFIAAGHGLAAAHEAGFIHRDFKPANVLLGDDGRVRVMDFGLARPFDGGSRDETGTISMDGDASEEVTEAGIVLGTPAYMAPEQCMDGPIDAAVDQYAFCVALWEGLTGKRPFNGKLDHRRLIWSKLQGPPNPEEALAAVPRPLRQALARGLAPKPEDRFGSMQALIGVLEGVSQRRRARPASRMASFALVTGVVTAGGLSLGLMQADAVDACDRNQPWLASAWNDELREGARRGLVSTGKPQAAQAWQDLEPRLADYATRWTQQRRDACWAAQDGATEADARLRCLDEGRRALGALVRALAEAGPETLARASLVVGRLPDPAQCTGVDVQTDEPPRPTDPERAAAVDDARERLVEITVQIQLGHYADALTRARALLDEVESLDYPPLWIEVAFRIGQATDSERRPGATALLERAYFEARAHGLDRRAAHLALLLIRYVGITIEQGEHAMQWIEHAQGLVSRLDDPKLRVEFHVVAGEAHHSAGRVDLAIEHKERALELTRALYEPDDYAIAVAELGLSSIYELVERYDEALALGEHAKSIVVDHRGPDHPDVAQILHTVGNVQREMGKLEAARRSFERALEINESLFGPDDTRVAGSLNNLALVEQKAERNTRALALMDRAIEIRQALLGREHPAIARMLINRGTALHALGRAQEAEAAFRESGRITEHAYGLEHDAMIDAILGQGIIAGDQGRNAEALALLTQGLEIAHRLYAPGHFKVERFQHNLELVEKRIATAESAGAERPATAGRQRRR